MDAKRQCRTKSRKRRPRRPAGNQKKLRSTARQRKLRAGRAFTAEEAPLIKRILGTIGKLAPKTRKWLVLNISVMAVAMLVQWRGARSGNGLVTLSALARTMPLDENIKMREKRLYRLLANPHLEGPEMTPLLVRLALGDSPPPWVLLVVDQTTIRGVETIMVGAHLAGRVLPVAFACFEKSKIRKSQNALESALLKLVISSLPTGCKPIFVMDRGYARVALLQELRQLGTPYLIRTKKKVSVWVEGKKKLVGQLKRRRRPVRYTNLLYQGTRKEPVDLVVYHDPDFKEPWFLVVPPHSIKLLPTDEVVALYRQRMHIELTFRDWKTHLGVRGLRLQVDKAVRLSRLLLALTAAYILVVLLGAVPAAFRVRMACERLRTTPRHGTRNRLSAMSVGILMLSLARFASLARRILFKILAALRRGRGGISLVRHHYGEVCPS